MDNVDCRNNSNVTKLMIIISGIGLLFVAVLFSIVFGTVKLSFSELISILTGNAGDTTNAHIVWNIRLPRVLTGLLSGVNLAVAGVLLQGILRNPMASPNIIGVNAGAGLAAVVIMVVFPGNINAIPIVSFSGAVIAAVTVYVLSLNSKSSTVHIVLAGVALSALFNAMTSALMSLNVDDLAISYTWLLGSLSGRGWTYFKLLYPYSLIGLIIAIYISPKVNLLVLGDEIASSVGLSVRFYKIVVILIAALLAGSAVSVAGTIGFIGLIAPHIARLFIGHDHRYLVPFTGIVGGILLVASDTVARLIFQPVELSVGVITSLFGAPFFLFLLYNKGKNGKELF